MNFLKMNSTYLAAVVFIILSSTLGCHLASAQKTSNFDIQLDPTPFFLKGYAGEVGLNVGKHRIYVTAASYEAVSFLKEDKNFDEKRDLIVGAGYQYYLKEKLKGFYAGGSILNTWCTFTNPGTKNNEKLATTRVSARIGYVFYPIKNIKLLVNPWVGPYVNINPPTATIDGLSLQRKSFYYTATIQIGYLF